MSTSFLKADRLSGYFEGTCNVNVDQAAKVKKTIPPHMIGATEYVGVVNGEGVYLEGGKNWVRSGFNFPNAADEFSAATTSSIRVCMLTNTLGIVIYIVSTKLYAKAFTIGAGGDYTFGSAVTVNDADTGIMPSICKVSASSYAICYVDDGGDDYVFIRMGSVSGTTITQGDESASMSGTSAATVDEGTGICMPRSGVLAVVYSDDDTYGYCAAVTFSALVVGTPGTAVEFATASQNSDLATCCSHADGYIAVAYQDADNSDYLTINIGTVSAAAVVAFGGTEEALNAATTTDICISSPRTDSIVITWMAAGDPYIIAGGVLSTAVDTFVQGSAVGITTTAFTGTVAHAPLDATHVALIWGDDGTFDQGHIVRYTIAWAATADGTCTADSVVDFFLETGVETSAAIAAGTDGKVTVGLADTDNSAHGQCLYGEYRDDLIDLRSSVASATYGLWLVPVYERVKTN